MEGKLFKNMTRKRFIKILLSRLLTLIKYLTIALAAGLIFFLVLGLSLYNNIHVMSVNALQGKNYLLRSGDEIKVQQWNAALDDSQAAQADFERSLKALNVIRQNTFVSRLKILSSQADNLGYLLNSGQLLSQSLNEILPLFKDLALIQNGTISYNFNALSDSQKLTFLNLISGAEPQLSQLDSNLKQAIYNLNLIPKISILRPMYGQITDIKDRLSQISGLASKISPLIKLLPVLAGEPKSSHYFLVLQNNDELRPSGGFIGNYGLLTIKNGNIISLKTDDSYHLDMPASQSINWRLAPPSQLKNYLNVKKWYLRDANWSPDWPQAAKQIVSIYNGENQAINQPTDYFTGVIAINPDLVADLINLTGPITVNGTTYNSDNFQPLLQYNVEVAYKNQDISSWNRKDVINQIVSVLKNRLFNLPTKDWPQLFKILNANIDKKNIQIYLFNPNYEKLVVTLGADGSVNRTNNNDFLMVVDANLAAFKTDSVMKKSLSYSVKETTAGAQARLTLSYKHQGGFDWRTTRYRSYTRVYVPLGSKFLGIKGLNKSTMDFSTTNGPVLNKTVFGFFLQ